MNKVQGGYTVDELSFGTLTHTQTHTERERESHPATKEGTQDEFPEKGLVLHL